MVKIYNFLLYSAGVKFKNKDRDKITNNVIY